MHRASSKRRVQNSLWLECNVQSKWPGLKPELGGTWSWMDFISLFKGLALNPEDTEGTIKGLKQEKT